ncbi:class I SAM-dependent methyltransferase [Paractinoplanes lichenicola]|uniref:Class I SAM-dependent methyltransferase n=1 Tax=Paractinoplanes lichenicola TaxID=2802976 RepID=A0ABS1VY37_9ACTN|nr:class I SAM-dependent methyltransferase [Actinoplanes lichenicola]MBL7259397.1 class I SAM-dependent methyltransferase [Actinoplanes lichenicola]
MADRATDIRRRSGSLMTYGPAMAAAYDRGRRLREGDVERWMVAARPYLPSGAGWILDLGAGTGRFSDALAAISGASVVACEPSADMRAVLRANVPVVGGTGEAIPFGAGVFDAVWASQMIHHVGDLPGFAAELRRVLRPAGRVLIRGGFGPVQEIPLYRYFPSAWADGTAARLGLDRITEVLTAAGFATVECLQVEQTFVADADEFVEKAASRSLSPLAALPDQAFEDGLAALRRDAAEGRVTGPIVERLDLVVFRAGP